MLVVRGVFGMLFVGVGLVLAAGIFGLWVRHPHLTEMQFFLRYWWMEALCIGTLAVGMTLAMGRQRKR